MGYKTTGNERTSATSTISSEVFAYNNPDGTGFAVAGSAVNSSTQFKQVGVVFGQTTLNSTATMGSSSITAVTICDNTYTALDDIAVNTAGGYIKLTGTGFITGCTIYVNGTAATTTTFVSSTEVRAVVGALASGTYSLMAFNTTGSGAIWASGLTYSGFPTITTSAITSPLIISTQLVATGDGTLTYSLQGGSTLPTGITLSSTGLLSGTVTGVTVSTVYTFTVLVNDPQLQTVQQLITLSVVVADPYFNSTVLSLQGDGPAIPTTIEILVVAGGGGGRGVSGNIAGIRDSAGGGAGGVIYNSALAITSGAVYPLSIGVGGASATNGVSSVWNTSFTASGGGAGGQVSIAGSAGGSGGGGANYQSAAGATNQSAYSGWTVYGNAGGAGIDTGPAWGAGGGGGAGAVGGAGTSTTGGAGGVGISKSITGVATYYAGGGAGGGANGAIAAGGTGGGGASTNSAIGGAATPNTGGGGGGVGNTTGVTYAGGAGGSGVSVIAYPSAYADLVVSAGLTYTMSTVTRSGYKVYTFTAGTGTITIPSNNNNTFKDSSTNNFAITRTGTPTQGTFTPFSQTGWSGYFNGTTDYLTAPNNAAFEMGAGDYTVECWFYATPADATIDGGLVFKGQFQSGTATWLPGFGIRRRDDTRLYYYFNTSTTNAGEIRYVHTGASNSNAWHHVAMVVQSGIGYAFLDGVLLNIGGTSGVGTIGTSATPITIGMFPATAANIYFPGCISNLRIVKGTALYTSNFIPSTTPLTAVSGTSLLTLQDNRFKDNSSNNFAITATGTPSIQAISPFAPADAYSTSLVGGSMYFNGTTDYVSVPSTSGGVLDLTTVSVFTVEAWVYCKVFNGASIITNRNALSTSGFDIRINATGTVETYYTGIAGSNVFTTSTLMLNTWNHISLVRNGVNSTVFINGISRATSSSTVNGINGIQAIWIGTCASSGSSYFNGYISNLRVLNGTALYTTAFTPPTAPLTPITNTSLLLNATNAGIYDATAKNDLITVGTSAVSATQSKFGGKSMFFNGTTDYLNIPNSQSYNFGAGNFTIEFWMYSGQTSQNSSNAALLVGNITSGGVTNTNWAIYMGLPTNPGDISFYASDGTTYQISGLGGGTVNNSTWNHIAVTRSGSAFYMFINGVQTGSTGSWAGSISSTARPLNVGYNTSSAYYNGYIDDLRITKGIARYTANFAPPVSASLDK